MRSWFNWLHQSDVDAFAGKIFESFILMASVGLIENYSMFVFGGIRRVV